MSKFESIVLGFCKCKRCGRERFVWNSYFACDNCGGNEYEKSKVEVEENENENGNEE